MQTEVGRRLGVHKGTIQNWERGVGMPGIRQMPGIIEFLGYDPEPEPSGLQKRIAYARRRLGLTQEDLANVLQTDPVMVWHWEAGHSTPAKATLQRMQRLLTEGPIPGFIVDLPGQMITAVENEERFPGSERFSGRLENT